MKNISTGAGLAIVGLGIALHPVLSNVLAAAPSANAAPLASLVASAATAQAVPTVVWMAVTQSQATKTHFFRMWSDGQIEFRAVSASSSISGCDAGVSCSTDWIEIPPPPGGNGFACRADMNGDRLVDGADLGIMLNAWGQQGGCEPDATYSCLDLGNLAGALAASRPSTSFSRKQVMRKKRSLAQKPPRWS